MWATTPDSASTAVATHPAVSTPPHRPAPAHEETDLPSLAILALGTIAAGTDRGPEALGSRGAEHSYANWWSRSSPLLNTPQCCGRTRRSRAPRVTIGIACTTASIAAVDRLPCEVLIAVHPSAPGLDDTLAARARGVTPDPLIDVNASPCGGRPSPCRPRRSWSACTDRPSRCHSKMSLTSFQA